jgi:hypothetical protein
METFIAKAAIIECQSVPSQIVQVEEERALTDE